MDASNALVALGEGRTNERLYPQVVVRLSVNRPVDSGISKRVYGHTSQDVCPWNVSFATELKEPAFAARELFVGSASQGGTRALAREMLMLEPGDYAVAFRGSAIKRAKLWMLQRNACVVLGNVGASEDVPLLEAMLAHEDAIVREHAAWATARLETDCAS